LPSVVVPRRFDPWIIDQFTELALRLRPGKVERLASRMSNTLGPRSRDRDLTEAALAQYQMMLEDAWARARNLHARGWEPTITVEGLERIRAAQAAGAGTILWRMSFGSSLVAIIGLWRAGVPLVHLSSERHGALSLAWIARTALCPLYRRTEHWFLRERVVIPWDGSTGVVMKTLLQRLSGDNAVVSIIGDQRGTQNVTTPFFGAQAQFAIGAPSLAWKAGSTLLPVYSVREGTGSYRVVIDEPIGVKRQLDRKEYAKQAVHEFSARMQDAIVRHPGSWSDWGRFWARGSIYRDVAAPPQPPAKIIA
jgi:lauroyl/myristoyl acyltransferase